MNTRAAATLALTLTLALPLCSPTALADNFRCGKWIASADLSVTELLAKCGEPLKRESRKEAVFARGVNGGSYKTGEMLVETWTYLRGAGSFPMVVTIIDGRIDSIERQE